MPRNKKPMSNHGSQVVRNQYVMATGPRPAIMAIFLFSGKA
jgi:hypothetical protein